MQLKPEAKKIIDASDPHWVDVQPAGRFLFDFIASENPDMGRRWRFRAGGRNWQRRYLSCGKVVSLRPVLPPSPDR